MKSAKLSTLQPSLLEWGATDTLAPEQMGRRLHVGFAFSEALAHSNYLVRRDKLLAFIEKVSGTVASRRGVRIRSEMLNSDAPATCEISTSMPSSL